jgi:hypothetical protein
MADDPPTAQESKHYGVSEDLTTGSRQLPDAQTQGLTGSPLGNLGRLQPKS